MILGSTIQQRAWSNYQGGNYSIIDRLIMMISDLNIYGIQFKLESAKLSIVQISVIIFSYQQHMSVIKFRVKSTSNHYHSKDIDQMRNQSIVQISTEIIPPSIKLRHQKGQFNNFTLKQEVQSATKTSPKLIGNIFQEKTVKIRAQSNDNRKPINFKEYKSQKVKHSPSLSQAKCRSPSTRPKSLNKWKQSQNIISQKIFDFRTKIIKITQKKIKDKQSIDPDQKTAFGKKQIGITTPQSNLYGIMLMNLTNCEHIEASEFIELVRRKNELERRQYSNQQLYLQIRKQYKADQPAIKESPMKIQSLSLSSKKFTLKKQIPKTRLSIFNQFTSHSNRNQNRNKIRYKDSQRLEGW